MKKILFSAYDLNIGGIETALVNLVNYLVDEGYDITLVLEHKRGIFLNELDSRIKVVEYTPNDNKNVILRKAINAIKRMKFIIKYKNKFDFSASFATYSRMGSFVARCASENNALWIHSDYMAVYKQNTHEVKLFFDALKCEEFKHIVLVSKASYKSFAKVYPKLKNKLICCGNIINYKKIEMLANKGTELVNKEDIYTFLNVGRHDETEKRLSRIILAAKILKQEGLSFRILFVGTGKDTNMYKEMIEKEDLQNNIKLLGAKKNPYPYFKIADSVILTSDYEGYPVVFLESFILNKPIITTDVSDAKEIIENKFGKVVSKNVTEIYSAMKDFMINEYQIKEKFDADKYNKEIIDKLKTII